MAEIICPCVIQVKRDEVWVNVPSCDRDNVLDSLPFVCNKDPKKCSGARQAKRNQKSNTDYMHTTAEHAEYDSGTSGIVTIRTPLKKAK